MQNIFKHTHYVFLAVFIVTSALACFGVLHLWLDEKPLTDLPYLETLLGATVLEVAILLIAFYKKAMDYLPDVSVNKTLEDTNEFMSKFISRGSSVVMVSNRMGWLSSAVNVKETMIGLSENGTRIEIITHDDVPDDIRDELEIAGVVFIVISNVLPPEARFTLLNMDRSGAEVLAIGKGVHPNHEITVFNHTSGPQIIGMAKDIVKWTREAANV